jgi:hypothetical protein
MSRCHEYPHTVIPAQIPSAKSEHSSTVNSRRDGRRCSTGGVPFKTMIDRHLFRAYPLDGAALYFQPASGVHVRVSGTATRELRRQAPRVVMFGITNVCNLTCDFCSRDVTRDSGWTVASAAAALRGLSDAGTLEVAYGGGEPFAFNGFDELVAEVNGSTALAQHVTTNGTLIRAATWPRFAGRFGQVRLSVYEGVAWREVVETLASAGQRWGANLLVDGPALASLPAMLAELAARGCHDVSLLSYVGPEARRHLDGVGDRQLAAIIADSPVTCRLSVCFGDRVAVPRLHGGDTPGDCGAGRDFVSITPDRRVLSCSFQDRSFPGATAGDILAAWWQQQPALAAPSPRGGCARTLPTATEPAALPPIAIWRSFSGNNSGECLLVATFRKIDDAEAYLAELLPGWTPDGAYSPAWRQLFADEGVLAADIDSRFGDDASPREVVAIGGSVIAVQYAADDAFPELRALAWKRGAFVVPGGVHIHDGIHVLLAVKTRDDQDRERLLAAPRHQAWRLHAHGDVVLALALAFGGEGTLATLAEVREEVQRLAGDRRFAVELFFDDVSDGDLIAAMQRLGHRPARRPRLWVSYWGETSSDNASAFARTLPGERTTVVGDVVLVDPAPDRKRLAVLAYRHGASVHVLDGVRVELSAIVWYERPQQKGQRGTTRSVDDVYVQTTLRALLPRGSELTVTRPKFSWRDGPTITIATDAPADALRALGNCAGSISACLGVSASDLDPLGTALHRLLEDL